MGLNLENPDHTPAAGAERQRPSRAINRAGQRACPILASMPFLHATAAEIPARLAAVVQEAAGVALVVRVGEERAEHRNIGVDLPRAKSRHDARLLRLRIAAALEKARVLL